MTDILDSLIEQSLDRIDRDIADRRLMLRHYVHFYGRRSAWATSGHHTLCVLRTIRAEIVRTSGYRRPVAA